MSIVFVCGSLQPGCDGVGDYTRRLAAKLIETGHMAAIVALNDMDTTNYFDGMQLSGDIKIPVLRLSTTMPLSQRYQRAALWIKDFNPEWLSLQYVPFAFHPKGLAFNMGNKLAQLGHGKRWHLMVHELWVGMDKEAPLKFVFWGWLQKQLIKSLILKLNPVVVHTHCGLYMKMLEKMGFKPKYLPLFGNISITSNTNNGLHRIVNDINKEISFIVFGGIHAGAPVGQFAKDLKNYSNNNGVKVVLKIVGRCGNEQTHWVEKCAAAGLAVDIMGEQSEENVSEILSNSTFGISTTPAPLIEKSGSVAAMREHGLTVLCISRPWHARGICKLELPAGIVVYKQGEIESFISSSYNPYRVNISEIARQFVNNLLSPDQYGKH